MTRREQREGIRGRHLLPPTPEDLARDLLAEYADAFRHVPLTAPVACGRSYLAAVRRAVVAEAQVAELLGAIRRRHGDIDDLLAIIRAIVETCPWQYDAGGHPAFWHNMRVAQDLLGKIDREARQ